MSSTVTSAPFSRAVVNAMRKLYPEALADKSWDNTGLLLEAPFDPLRRNKNSVLLAVDLTRAVADEAIERNASIVVAYHPIIFRGLKSLTLANSQQQSLLRLAAKGISVYCPHTAVDAAPGGLGDWLADVATGSLVDASEQSSLKSAQPSPLPAGSSEQADPFVDKRPLYMLRHHPSQSGSSLSIKDLRLGKTAHTRQVITPVTGVPGVEGAGMGRIVRFETPQTLTSIIERIGQGLGDPKGFPIAIPQGSSVNDIKVSSIGICAGSGGSLFSGIDVDLLFTGELSHHEALAAIEKGQVVITLFHSNTERGFLHSVMKDQLLEMIRDEWDYLRAEEKGKPGLDDKEIEALDDESITVEVSERDRDPYGIIIAQE
ncbi:Protein NIF3-like protein [Lasiodiplodia hormozganensis]|uniref:Protein NIF3-like protein n=2 Tax=Lasiodiplodia TaxID=66739 RepID=A0A5N5DEG8_9PEZI|nr:NGG1p interacting factor 3 NIF3 [Lasiodiplodia theobromae]KAB2575512.1 Protein NIF3-like protein [Lasiodiplodia theobromae]KAF4536364.1 NGG1p interacting factor 3 NIF3 [Lasiodiplodia theobromae]KAK0642465.1 Protein NIF3-like protein [Lasiodiplodia hormozganensis]